MDASTIEQLTTSAATTVGAIVAADYRTARVFENHGIDFCCGGKISLAEICQQKGFDPAALRQELAATLNAPVERGHNYDAWSLSFLADYIVNTHHAYLDENTAQIAAYAEKIAGVHGDNRPELIEIAAIFARIAADMAAHLREEEEVLFPTVKRIEAARTGGNPPDAEDQAIVMASLAKLDHEHQEIGDAVHAIRHLAHDYAIPADACNTFTVTYRKLKEFEDDLHLHVHLENNILFPKASRL